MTALQSPKPASLHVQRAQQQFAQSLADDDLQDFEDAQRGFIDTIDSAAYTNGRNHTVWSLARHTFLQNESAPDSVNPSLWRQGRLNMVNGLFKVVDGVYQVRELDLANMTIIEGETGVIVIDPLSTQEGAAAALALYRKNRGNRPVVGVMITHTHSDHWGGTLGVASLEDFESGRIPLIAPDKFMDYAVSENVLAGNAMRRRSFYQFGMALPPGERGQVDSGLGKTLAIGRMTLVRPNDLIVNTGETRTIDGVVFEFQMAPETEAPAEFHIFMPQKGVLNMAENACHTFHNLLPFRGAQVRNSLNWTHYISEALQLWGERSEVLIAQHHWPIWGQARVRSFLETQADLYKFVHDQTLRLLNQGQTAQEIAETLALPRSISDQWHTRGYYGSLRHNVKAVYQFYLGWYDCVPAHLDPLPPTETGAKTIEYMGGIDAAVAKARQDFDAGEYRWVAQVMNHAVFADPTHDGARQLLADAYEQLGYLAESSTWRNSYLFGAHELRNGTFQTSVQQQYDRPETIASLTHEQIFYFLGTRIDPAMAEGVHLKLRVVFDETQESYLLTLRNCTLSHTPERQTQPTDVSIQTTRSGLARLMLKRSTHQELMATGELKLDGDPQAIDALLACFSPAPGDFNIVEP